MLSTIIFFYIIDIQNIVRPYHTYNMYVRKYGFQTVTKKLYVPTTRIICMNENMGAQLLF